MSAPPRDTNSVTMAHEAIHNPTDPRHFMRLKPANRHVRILLADKVLAETNQALRVLEVGKDFYDPIFYVPRNGVIAKLAPSSRQTHCPLKGNTTYYDLVDGVGGTVIKDAAWSYTDTMDFAAGLHDLVAFDPAFVTIEESPPAQT